MVKQYDIHPINLDPTVGSEIRQTRSCVIVSSDEMNQNLRTVQIVPMTSNTSLYPWRVLNAFKNKKGTIALGQLSTIDKQRIIKYL